MILPRPIISNRCRSSADIPRIAVSRGGSRTGRRASPAPSRIPIAARSPTKTDTTTTRTTSARRRTPTTNRRRWPRGADRGVGTTSWRRREFSSTTLLASSATTKNSKTIALAVLAASALALAEYGAARSSSSAVADFATVSSGRNNYDDANYHHRPAVVIGGHQARIQVPIPVEYSNFVELAEFADAVAALRAHRDGRTRERAMDDRQRQQQKREEQTRPHPHRIDSEHNIDDADLGNTTEHNDNEEGDDRGGGQVED